MKLLLFAAALLAVMALLLTIVPGFQFSIVLCLAFAALSVLFYFLLKFPTPLNAVIVKVLCVLLIVGILAAGVTLGFILSAAHPLAAEACDSIVVLGAAVQGTVPSLALQERINAAYNYLIANPDSIAVLSGGQGRGEEITEAACMYRELTNMGIDGSRLLLEQSSTSTIENLRFSLAILETHTGSRPAKIGIVSSEYHIFRATLFAKSLNLESVGIPARTSWFIIRLNYYLREVAAVWKYLVLGP